MPSEAEVKELFEDAQSFPKFLAGVDYSYGMSNVPDVEYDARYKAIAIDIKGVVQPGTVIDLPTGLPGSRLPTWWTGRKQTRWIYLPRLVKPSSWWSVTSERIAIPSGQGCFHVRSPGIVSYRDGYPSRVGIMDGQLGSAPAPRVHRASRMDSGGHGQPAAFPVASP